MGQRMRLAILLTSAGLLAAGPAPAAHPAQPIAPTAPVSPALSRTNADWAILADPVAGRMAQRTAAARLILSADQATQARLAEVLVNGLAPPNGAPASDAPIRTLLLDQIIAQVTVPHTLLEPLRTLLARADRLALLAAEALGSIRTPAAARALVDAAANHAASRDLQAACARGLRRLSGRADLGNDPRAWAGWLATVEFLPEPEWRRVLLEGLAARADDLAASRAAILARFLELRRREFLDTPVALQQRWDLLAGLLIDDLPEVRQLGIELLKRELANGRVPDPVVVDSVADLLDDPSPDARAAGAELLSALAPPNAGALVADALIRETDHLAAGALLQAAARWPTEQVRAPALHWLTSGPPARAGAIEALAALRRADLLNDPESLRSVPDLLAAIPPALLSDAGARLLVQMGRDEHRRAVADWLTAPALELRLRAAQALVTVPDGVPPLLAAAAADPALFDFAAQAVTLHQPSPEALVQLAALPGPATEPRAAALARLADQLSLAQVVAAARSLQPLPVREQVLARRLAPSTSRPAAAAAEPASVQGWILLARTRLLLGQPSRALDALAQIELPDNQTLHADALAARITALVWLNRLDEAERLGNHAHLDAWLDALESAIDLAHAPAVAGRLAALPADQLTPAQRERLDALRERLRRQPPPDPPAPPPPTGQ